MNTSVHTMNSEHSLMLDNGHHAITSVLACNMVLCNAAGGGYNYDSTEIPPRDDQRYDRAAVSRPK